MSNSIFVHNTPKKYTIGISQLEDGITVHKPRLRIFIDRPNIVFTEIYYTV